MKIKNLILMLVCLGMVSFASSTASALTLEEVNTGTIAGVRNIAYLRTLPGDQGFSIIGDLLSSVSSYDIWVATYDKDGASIAMTILDGGLNQPDFIRNAVTDPDGNTIALSMSRADDGLFYPTIWTVSRDGLLLDTKMYMLSDCTSIQLIDFARAADGTLFIAGHAKHSGSSYYDIFVLRDPPVGGAPDYIVSWYSDPTGNDTVKKMIVDDSDNSIRLAAHAEDRSVSPVNVDYVIRKIASDGTEAFATRVDKSSTYDSFVDMDFDGTNTYVAEHFRSDADGNTYPYLLKLNDDGSIAAENTPPVTDYTTVRATFMSPETENWLVATWARDAATLMWYTNIYEVDRATLAVVSETLDTDTLIADMIAPSTAAQSAAYKGDLLAIVLGRQYPSGSTGKAEYFLTNGSSETYESVYDPYYTAAEMISDDGSTVFMGGSSSVGIAWTILKPKTGGGHSKPFHPGPNQLVEFPDEFAVYVSVLIGEATGDGTVTVIEDPEGIGEMINSLPVGLPYDITIEGGYNGDTVDITLGFTEDAPLGTWFLKYDPEGGWHAYGESVERDDENNTLTVHVDHECVFSLGVAIPVPATENLIALVYNMNFKQGIANSLDAKLQNIRDALTAANAGLRNDALNKFQAFVNAVEAQRGNAITEEQATLLIAEAKSIMAAIEAGM